MAVVALTVVRHFEIIEKTTFSRVFYMELALSNTVSLIYPGLNCNFKKSNSERRILLYAQYSMVYTIKTDKISVKYTFKP